MGAGTADDLQFPAGKLEVESEPEAEQSRLELLVTLLPCYLGRVFKLQLWGVKSFFAVLKGVSNQSLVSVNAIYVPTKVNAASVRELAGTLDRMVSNS